MSTAKRALLANEILQRSDGYFSLPFTGSVQPDSPDSLHAQEVLLPGHLMTMMVKEKMQDYLAAFRDVFIKDTRPGSAHASQVDFADQSYIESLVSRNPIDIGKKIDYFMATGNLVSQTGLDLMQVSGYSIVAERLNFLRYVSHFRSIHRGQFFTTMKSTAVRKLLPESWGFVCPVHTPDGGPCGLLNHLTAICKIDSNPNDPEATPSLVPLLISLGASPGGRGGVQVLLGPDHLPITLDGLLVGHIHQGSADAMVDALRMLRSTGDPRIPDKLEIGYVPVRTNGLWAGLFLFTTPARMMRPVKNIKTGGVEKIGTLEQIHMEIAVKPQEILPGVHSHVELDPMNMLSVVAQCTPFSDMNQSPRNMYQCQMGKQTMGTPMFAYQPRVDNKVYRIITPQIPLVRNQAQDTFNMDDYPTGANAVVAVISYTGYDMEDAMIINKGAYDRGFGNGHVYTHYVIELAKEAPPGSRFSNPRDNDFQEHLDSDGLPMIGEHLQQVLWPLLPPPPSFLTFRRPCASPRQIFLCCCFPSFSRSLSLNSVVSVLLLIIAMCVCRAWPCGALSIQPRAAARWASTRTLSRPWWTACGCWATGLGSTCSASVLS